LRKMSFVKSEKKRGKRFLEVSTRFTSKKWCFIRELCKVIKVMKSY